MFRWLQDQIHKKKSDRASTSEGIQSVEVATDAVIYDGAVSHEREPAHRDRNTLSDLSRIQPLEQRQDSLYSGRIIHYTKGQESEGEKAEGEVATYVAYECSQSSSWSSAKCPPSDFYVDIKNLSCNSSTSLSSITGKEGLATDAHHHCSQENSSNISSTQQPKEDTFFAQNITRSSSNLEKNRESPFLQTHKDSTHGLQEHIGSTTTSPENQRESSQEHLRNIFIQEHSKNLSTSQEECGGSTIYSQGYAEGNSSSQKHRETVCNTQKFGESISSPQEYSIDVESISGLQQHGKSIITSQEHIENNPITQELAETNATKQYHRESVSSPQQESTESTSCSQRYVKSTTNTLDHNGSVSNPLMHTECTSNAQQFTGDISKPPDLDTFHDSGNPQSWSSLSLPSLTSEASTELPRDPPLYPPGIIHQGVNTSKVNIKKDEEQENKTSQDTEKECIFEVKLAKKPDHSVNEVAISEEATSKKIEENGHSNEKHLTSNALDESLTDEAAIGASHQVRDCLRSVCFEREFILECDKGSAKMEGNDDKTAFKVDRFSQTQNIRYHCPNPYCYPQVCLYNQKGRKCTVLGELFILTYLMESPVLVRTAIENTNTGPLGCMIVWCSGKPTEFRNLPDGTEIYFDAIVSPKAPNFVAVVIWQGIKPTCSIEPFFNCYVIVDLIRNCPLKFLSFSKENGFVSTCINGETMKIVFSKSVVHLDGQKVENANEIKKLSKNTTKQLYGDVLKLMTLDCANKVSYEFMCSRIWMGCKPLPSDLPTVYDPLKLYRKAVGYFPVASKQSLLLCDIDALLEIEDTTCKITFENDGQPTVLSCDKKKLCSGNQRVLPVSGKVKVHLRKTVAKSTNTWLILMVQVQSSSPIETASSVQPHHTSETAGHSSPLQATLADETSLIPHTILKQTSCESTVLPDVTDPQKVTMGFTASDVVLKPQYTSTTNFVRGRVKSECVETGDMSNSMSNEHPKLSESPCISEMSGVSTLEEESLEAAVNVEKRVELTVKGNQSSHSDNVISQGDQHAPCRLMKNGSGVLKNIGETFILETQLEGKKVHIEVRKAPWVALEDGTCKGCQTPMPDLTVGFDAHFVDIPLVGLVGHILALWSGKKPHKVSLGNTTYYFDSPGVFHGLDEKGGFKFMVFVEGKLNFITTTSTTLIFEASGEQCASLATLSHVFLHLSLSQGTWTLFLVVLQPKHKSSNLTEEIKSVSPKLLSLLDSNTSSCQLNTEAKADNQNHMSATQKTSHAEVLRHYLRNLTGTLTETAGKRVISTHHKNILLSVEVPENCLVDVNAVSFSVKEIPLGTKVHVDAFCENIENMRYWAAVVWSKKKPQKSVAHTGCIFYYNVSGKCLNSNENEVSLEFIVENKIEDVVCKAAYIVMPDGTFQGIEILRVGTLVHANLLQQNQKLRVNNFIYIDPVTAHPSLTSVMQERDSEKTMVTRSMTQTGKKEELGLSEPYNKSEVELKSSSLKSVTADEKEAAAAGPDLVTQENEYDVVKGTIIELQHDRCVFRSDSGNLKVNINPIEMAVDQHLRPESLEAEFYLVYHKKAKVGMCGWYQHQNRQVYLQHGMIVHTHNLETKIITLGLPDHSSLYSFLFDSEMTVTGSNLWRFPKSLKSGKRVHPIIEDIKPILIDGSVISHRIVLLTTVKGLSVVCLNFLRHSLFENEQNKTASNGLLVSMSNSLPKQCGDGSGRGEHEYEGITSPLSSSINTNASLKQQQEVKQKKNEPEDDLRESVEFLSTSEGHTCSENSVIQPQVGLLFDKYYEGNIPAIDGEGETLRELISTRHPRMVSKTHIIRYVTLCGEIQLGHSGTHVFCSKNIPSPVEITPNLLHCDAGMCESSGRRFMLARKVCARESGIIDFQPLVVWPEERKCDPFIVVTYKVSRKKNLLLVTDAADGKEKWYLCDYNLVFSLKKSYKINEVIQSYSKQGKTLLLYAVVDKTPSFQIEDHCVEGNVLLLTTSKNVAVSSIDIFIGSCYEEDLYFQEPLSLVSQMLHLHKIRRDRASRCKRGMTFYFSTRDSSFDSSLKSVGGCLEAHIDDFGIISCDRKRSTAVCHLSNVYYQGENIASWDTIPKHHWKNFWTLMLPLDEALQEAKWEVNAVALIAWCCRGPRVLAMHQCYYHVPTPYVPLLETEESQETTPTNLLQSQGNPLHALESCAGTVMSLSELESWQCQAGSSIFAFHESILQSSGLVKLSGKVTLVNGTVVLFTSSENEVVKCKIPDIFIKDERCESVKKLVSEIDQTFTLVAQKCSPTVYLGKNIQMEVIIAFTASLRATGIHVCNKHACILENSLHKVEVAIAEEAFHDIAVLCEQSAQCSNYHMSKITISEVETPITPDTGRIMKHTLCYGFVMAVDKEYPDQVIVNLQQGPKSLILPMSRSRLMGLHRDLSLQHAVGHPLKMILYSVTEDEKEEYRILMGWGTFSKDCSMSPNSSLEPELPCSQISEPHCCPRAFKIKEFQYLYNSSMFEVKSLYLNKIDVNSGRGFFHWADEKPVTCKKEFIMGWATISHLGQPWDLLLAKVSQTREECPEALAAWQGDYDSLVVEVCDVHGTHALHTWQEKCIPSPPKRGRRNSEPSHGNLPSRNELMPHYRYRRDSEPADSSPFTSIKLRQSGNTEEDNPALSRSLPWRIDHSYASGLDIRSREYKQNFLPDFGSLTLLSIKENSVAGEEKVCSPSDGIEQFHTDQPSSTSSVCDGNDESAVLSLKSERDNSSFIVRPTLTTIRSNTFLCLDHHCGLIIDSSSHTVAWVKQGSLYINKTKPKESFKQLFSTGFLGIITALAVPLVPPDTLGDMKVTHEAVVAWLGSRPSGVGSMIKNISMMSFQPGSMLKSKTKSEERLECDPDMPYNLTSEVTEPYRGTLWADTVTLKILLRKLKTVVECFVQGYADHCGILMSPVGPVLFDRQLFSVTLQLGAASETPQSEHKTESLKALVLELEQPITVLGFEVKDIAAVMWSKEKPVIDADCITRSLNVYKMNWDVELIGTFDQLEMEDSKKKVLQQQRLPSAVTRVPIFPVSSKEYNVLEDVQEISAFCYPTVKEKLCTVLSLEDKYAALGWKKGQVLALWEDIWCQKEILKVGMKLQVICSKFSTPLAIFAHNFSHLAVLVYMCDNEPDEVGTIKFNWRKGITEKFAQIRGKLESKMRTVNLQVKNNASLSTQPKPTDLQLPSQPFEPMEDTTLRNECELLKLMDECGILKVKNPKEIKVIFQWSVVLINDEALPRQKWKETLQMFMEQKQTWQCSGKKLTPQERENVKERTGEDVQYKAELIWCKTCTSIMGIQSGAEAVLGTALASEALDDFGSYSIQLTDDTDNSVRKRVQPSCTSSVCPSILPLQPSSVVGSISGRPEFLLENKAKAEGSFIGTEGPQIDQYLHTPHQGSLWTARATLRIIFGKQETLSKCIVGGYAGHCGILTSDSGPILFDRKLINVTQQEDPLLGAPQSEQEKEILNALVLELEQPVEILGCEVQKISIVVWSGEKPEVNNALISKSLDLYKLNWIVVLTCNVSALTKKYKLKESVCHSFWATGSQNCNTSCCPEVLYYCSQDYSVRQHEVVLAAYDHVLLKHQDSLVLALRDDVKCSESYIKKGKYLWVITVKLAEPFEYCSFLITYLALLVYSGEVEPPEAAAIKLDWSRGKLEKLLSLEKKVNDGLEKISIRVKVDKPANVKPYSLGTLWPLTPDRPEGDTIFAVECEIFKLIKNSGLLKARERIVNGKEIRIFFQKGVVLINSKGLSKNDTLAVQMISLQKQLWRCTGERLRPDEIQNVKKRTGEEAQYKAKLVWCEVYPSVLDVHIPENKDVSKATDSIAMKPGIPSQSGGANAWTAYGQEKGMESLSEVDTPLTTGSKPKKRQKRRDKLDQEQKHGNRVGRLTEVHRTVAQVALEDEQLKYVARDKCFLYGLCLGKVELWHVLSIGLNINYELTEDGKEFMQVWLGDINPSEQALRLDTLRDWCLVHNVTPSATTALLMEAGWLPSDLTPTVAPEEDIDVVELAALHDAF